MQENAHPLDEMRRHWGLWLAAGIVIALLGIACILGAVTATLASVVVLGAFMLASGVLQLIAMVRASGWQHRGFYVVLGLLELAFGALLVLYPLSSAAALTLIMAAFIGAAGVMRIVQAAVADVPGRGWLLLAGAAGVLLALIVFAQWPFSGLWFIGLAVGISLLLNGASLAGLAWHIGHHRPAPVSW